MSTCANQCSNPCGTSASNTAACETLPSQIQNFTDQFFGQVIKTEVNGEVVWSLPCSLDIGLPANPRGVDEGLACYFLRLFQDGISGLAGPTGSAGADGADGANSYTVTLRAFAQPSVYAPLTQIIVVPNPTLVPGLGIFVQGSGSYQVMSVAPGGVLFVTLIASVLPAPTAVPAGMMVIPVGLPGVGVGPQGPVGLTGPRGLVGPTGAIGPAGATGAAGVAAAMTNGTYVPVGGSNDTVAASATTIDFTTSKLEFVAPTEGTYLVLASVLITGTGWASAHDLCFARLVNSDGTIYTDSEKGESGWNQGGTRSITLQALVITTADSQTISVQGWAGANNYFIAEAAGSYITWVRVA